MSSITDLLKEKRLELEASNSISITRFANNLIASYPKNLNRAMRMQEAQDYIHLFTEELYLQLEATYGSK